MIGADNGVQYPASAEQPVNDDGDHTPPEEHVSVSPPLREYPLSHNEPHVPEMVRVHAPDWIPFAGAAGIGQ